MAPRIVLLHATPVAVEPVEAAFAQVWPEAGRVNLLDDSLSPDRASAPALTEEMIDRFVSFGKYAYRTGADGVLVTCSAFGPAIERLAVELPIPVLKPNEAMFQMAVAKGRRIGMLATFWPAVGTMADEFEEYVTRIGATATLTTVLVEGAMTALKAGDAETHNRLLAECASGLAGFDIIMLAHFSTSRAQAAVEQTAAMPVLSAPVAAVRRIREMVTGIAPATA